jgi:hypothetical protein
MGICGKSKVKPQQIGQDCLVALLSQGPNGLQRRFLEDKEETILSSLCAEQDGSEASRRMRHRDLDGARQEDGCRLVLGCAYPRPHACGSSSDCVEDDQEWMRGWGLRGMAHIRNGPYQHVRAVGRATAAILAPRAPCIDTINLPAATPMARRARAASGRVDRGVRHIWALPRPGSAS